VAHEAQHREGPVEGEDVAWRSRDAQPREPALLQRHQSLEEEGKDGANAQKEGVGSG